MKTTKKLLTAGLVVAMGFIAAPMTGVAAPDVTIQQERAAHPLIVEAIHHMQTALRELESGKEDFGGNKAVAIADTRKAIHSLKRALYYRLKMDDAAIERAE